ncbi:hypothetical protein AOR09_21695 [Vibrio alginolyticus]|nr:hypothetical protein AOR09_21695 [Vibrio alginolyticus]KPM95477.1 hypothetical protein AOG25_24195 [Vibrio alginolyticus]
MKPEKTPLPQHFLLVDSESRSFLAVQNDELWDWPRFFLKMNESVIPTSLGEIRNLISACCEARENPSTTALLSVDSESRPSLAVQNDELWDWPLLFLKTNESVIPTSLSKIRNLISTSCEARENPPLPQHFLLVDSESRSSLTIQNDELWDWPLLFLKTNESVIPTSLGEIRNLLSTCCEARENTSATALFVGRF